MYDLKSLLKGEREREREASKDEKQFLKNYIKKDNFSIII
jgi:hypothetical protein